MRMRITFALAAAVLRSFRPQFALRSIFILIFIIAFAIWRPCVWKSEISAESHAQDWFRVHSCVTRPDSLRWEQLHDEYFIPLVYEHESKGTHDAYPEWFLDTVVQGDYSPIRLLDCQSIRMDPGQSSCKQFAFHLSQLRHLEVLRVEQSLLLDLGVRRSIMGLPKLNVLNIRGAAGNVLQEPCSYAWLKKCHKLCCLSLDRISLTSEQAAEIAELQNIKRLRFEDLIVADGDRRKLTDLTSTASILPFYLPNISLDPALLLDPH